MFRWKLNLCCWFNGLWCWGTLEFCHSHELTCAQLLASIFTTMNNQRVYERWDCVDSRIQSNWTFVKTNGKRKGNGGNLFSLIEKMRWNFMWVITITFTHEQMYYQELGTVYNIFNLKIKCDCFYCIFINKMNEAWYNKEVRIGGSHSLGWGIINVDHW